MYVAIRSSPETQFVPAGGSPSSAWMLIFSGRTPTLTRVSMSDGTIEAGMEMSWPVLRRTVATSLWFRTSSPSSRLEAPRNPATNSVAGDS
jgi:hypothetical protein